MWIFIGAFWIKQKPASKNCMFCLTEKYHIIFSTKNLLNKPNELITKCRHGISFIFHITKTIACLKDFSQNDYKIYFK